MRHVGRAIRRVMQMLHELDNEDRRSRRPRRARSWTVAGRHWDAPLPPERTPRARLWQLPGGAAPARTSRSRQAAQRRRAGGDRLVEHWSQIHLIGPLHRLAVVSALAPGPTVHVADAATRDYSLT